MRQDQYIDDLLYKLIFKNSKVILLSKNLYPDVQKYVIKEHVYYCPNGIPDIVPRLAKNEERNVTEILFLSNLMESKGIFVLLDGCKILQVKNIIFKCTIVGGIGDVNEQQFQAKIEEMGLTNCVTYIGEKFGKEKDSIFANSDIFIHPTLNDCFPLVLLEAMCAGLPIISTFEGGIPDIVDDGINGFLVPKKNAELLAERLEILIQNSELRLKMGNAGRDKFEKEFNVCVFENRLFRILDN